MITGRDDLSLEIIQSLNDKTVRVKDIPQKYGVSLDQAKRLSRYLKIKSVANDKLTSLVNEKIDLLGLKVLVIADLFKAEDWEGIEEILTSVNEHTTRDQLKQMVLYLEEKRERLKSFLKEVKFKIRSLEGRKENLKVTLNNLQFLKDESDLLFNKFKKYDKETKDFLLEHVGMYQRIERGQTVIDLVLIKRLDSLFQKQLKDSGIITYVSLEFIHVIHSIDEFTNAYLKRKKNHGGILWYYDTEAMRASKKGFSVPFWPDYKEGVQLVGGSILKQIEKTNKELKNIEKEIKGIEEEIKRLKKLNIKSFSEAVIASNMLSEKEIQKHGELQSKVGKWLYSKGYVVGFEITLPNGRRVDVAGFNENKEIVFVEVKASDNDFQNDKKWKDYLPFCDKFYFFGDWSFIPYSKDDKSDAGFLLKHGNTIEINCETKIEHAARQRDQIIFSISRAISKKTIYGY